MTLLLDRESLKAVLSQLSPFDLRTALTLTCRMEEDLRLSIRMKDLEEATGATSLSLRESLRRLEAAKLILVRKRGRGPGAKISIVVSPALGCDPRILPGFETGFDRLVDTCWLAFQLAERSITKEMRS